MDDAHFMAALTYVALNPVRAGLIARAEDWPWASTRAHLRGVDDALVRVAPLAGRGWNFAGLLREAEACAAQSPAGWDALRASEGTGRPLGTADFVADLERRLGRPIARRSPGRKPVQPGAPQPGLFG